LPRGEGDGERSTAKEIGMGTVLGRHWWMFALRAVVAALCGIAVLLSRDVSSLAFAHWFGVYAMVDGMLALTATVYAYDGGNPWGDPRWDDIPWYAIDDTWLPIATEGVLSFVAGFIILEWPSGGERMLPAAVGSRFLAIAVAQVLAAERLRRLSPAGAAMALAAAVSGVTGLALVVPLVAGTVNPVVVTGVAMLVEAALLAIIGSALLH
jgi:uncharacterized membrane protein HdeD (DUF308 family)